MTAMSGREKLIVALDLPDAASAVNLAEKLRGHVGMFKVGSELYTAEGPVLAHYLIAVGEKVFLDLKFHDIPNTVKAAARQAAQLGASMFNVHASGGRRMLEAAVEGARSTRSSGRSTASPAVLAVTLLTSLESRDLTELGVTGIPEEAVVRLARLAQQAGLQGVVASPREIEAIRRACGPKFLIVTPGIRPAAAAANDQVRMATPEQAVRAGADFIVVGRPITGAPDPVAAADAIVAEMEMALAPKT